MKNILLSFFALLFFSSTLLQTARADDNDIHYDRVRLSVTASAKLDNDIMVAIVYAEEEGSQVSTLSSIVNQKIRHGLDLVKKYPAIKHQTNAYSSSPIYNDNKIKGWRVRQSLRLESSDMGLMSEVLGKLQRHLALQSMSFTVSPQSKNKQDEQLIDEALEAFDQRATQVVKKLSRKGYKIIDINIATAGSRGVRPSYQMRAMAMEADAAPAISAGEQTVSVTVSGSIELE
ncbi:MAG TPA: DUF541 domain-containing protein [Thiotrichales bacterium]|nr:DUF541 domain-containing protein [Thiotrichales bacterium]